MSKEIPMSDKIPGWIPVPTDFPVKIMRDNQAKASRKMGSDGLWAYTFTDNKGRTLPIHGEVQHGVPPWVCENEECLAVWWDEEWDASACPVCGQGVEG